MKLLKSLLINNEQYNVGRPHKYVTQEEFNALTDEEKDDGSIYFITDTDDEDQTAFIHYEDETESEARARINSPSQVDVGKVFYFSEEHVFNNISVVAGQMLVLLQDASTSELTWIKIGGPSIIVSSSSDAQGLTNMLAHPEGHVGQLIYFDQSYQNVGTYGTYEGEAYLSTYDSTSSTYKWVQVSDNYKRQLVTKTGSEMLAVSFLEDYAVTDYVLRLYIGGEEMIYDNSTQTLYCLDNSSYIDTIKIYTSTVAVHTSSNFAFQIPNLTTKRFGVQVMQGVTRLYYTSSATGTAFTPNIVKIKTDDGYDKLNVVTEMPTGTSGLVVLYMGATTSDYIQGTVYKYENEAWSSVLQQAEAEIVELTDTEYASLVANGTVDADKVYFVTDQTDTTSSCSATITPIEPYSTSTDNITFDSTTMYE